MPSGIPTSPDHHGTNRQVSKSDFWNAIYKENESPRWNIGRVFPALRHWLETERPKPGRVLIPGCGYGYDVREFAEHGFEAVGVDFAELAVTRAQELQKDTKGHCTFRCEDIFELAKTDAGSFDYIYEYTCFVAIKPERREEYVKLEHELLKPGGLLIGAFFNHGQEGGPPWNASPEDVRKVYEPLFEIRTLETTKHSVEKRLGKELWAEFVRKA